ncbi:MAG: 2Fe-2S iron-sulfur cluster binding domain-containing protein [Deltaproteobacteria bacterium]|nr:2Fe-2S iron-sulfur cluster binding domain-containing protein [Deltaproteobacteria bacterium]
MEGETVLQLVIGILILSAIGALLALLLEIANFYIADYGESHILINDEKDVVVEGGNPLLFSLMGEGIYIPSACGGKGTCSLCKVKVLEGGGPVLPTETPYLDRSELEGMVRLSCQVKVRNDLKIEVPEEIFLIKEFEVETMGLSDLTPDIRELCLKILAPEEGIRFKPGQYIQLEVPKYKGTKSPEYRAYSVSSSAEDRHAIELVITRVPEGAVTTYVHEHLKKGDRLLMTGPYGDFFLRESERDILFIATGSGLAPIKSILHQMEFRKTERKATLFFGDRRRYDLYYLEELKAFEESIPGFTFVPTLSRAMEEDQWEGEKGRVTDLIEKHVPENASLDVYICGSPAMVDSCEEILEKKGIAIENIYYDKFE